MEGNLVSIGTANGTAGLSQSPRTLVVRKDDSGAITCLWFISNNPESAQWTEEPHSRSQWHQVGDRRQVARRHESLGQDGLQGRPVPAGPVAARPALAWVAHKSI